MYSLEFVSIGCNRLANCVDWGQNNLVAYGAHNFVAIYDPEDGRVLTTLPGHKSRVNSVKWLPNVECEDPLLRLTHPEVELASASSDKSVIIWKMKPDHKWQATALLQGHEDAVTGLAKLSLNDATLLLASCSGDRTVRIWKRSSPREKESMKWSVVQVISFPKIMECVAFAFFPQCDIPLLAVGGVDSLIYLFAYCDGQFKKITALQGHEDWIRCLSFARSDDDELFLASSSQDKRIRLWKIKTNSPSSATDTTSATQNLSQNLLLSKFAVTDNESMSIITMSQKGLMITLPKGESFSIILESVLVGHDDWVLGICWAMPQWQADTKKIHQPMSLVSASMDRTMILWEPEPSSGLWIEKVRVGDIGGNHLGFFGTAFGKDGRYLLAHGYNGAFHLWKSKPETDEWVPHVTVSGHFDEVRDISWDPTYHYLISVSKDQTSRLWAQWFRSEEYITKNTPNRLLSKVTWNEIARPQIHGHDLNCLSFINNRLHRFVSGAEEKVIRVFDAPRTFVDNLKNITNWKTEDNDFEKRPLTANVPPLGLSNKPIFDQKSSLEKSETESILEKLKASMSGDEGEFEGDAFDWEENKMNYPPLILQQPPFEEHLLQRTLWAEIEKLYGHGNEIISLSGSHSGDLLASSCKGTTADQSAIRIWCTTKWKEKCVLKAHTLTVTQMSWSHDDRYLLSISRDRCFCVSQIIRKGDDIEAKLLKRVKAHARILWGCDWAPDDKYFATASRDKKVKIWSSVTTNNSEVDWVQDSQLEFKHSVTAVAWAPLYFSAGSTKADGANTPPFNYILAVGLESGGLSLWSATSQFDDSAKKSTLRWTSFLQIETLHSHNETVRRIRWRLKPTDYPQVTENRLMAIAGTTLELATCSKDHSVRLFAVTIKS